MALKPEELPLRDIHLPPPILGWPPAPGWWILAGVVVVGAIVCAIWIRWRHVAGRNAFRKAALAELAELRVSAEEPARCLQRLSTLLRRVVISLDGESRAAGLTGDAWLEHLDATLGDHRFTQGPGRLLSEGPYRPRESEDLQALYALTFDWLKRVGKRK